MVLSILIILSAVIVFPHDSHAIAVAYAEEESMVISSPAIPPSDEAIVILKTDTIGEMQIIQRIIEKFGGTIRIVIPPSVIIGSIPEYTKEAIASLGLTISYDKIDTINTANSGSSSSVADGIAAWNHIKGTREEKKRSNTAYEEGKKVPFDDLVIMHGLPKTKEEIDNINKEYLESWAKTKTDFLYNERTKRLSRVTTCNANLDDENLIYEELLGYKLPSLDATISDTGFGATTYDAGNTETSLYLIGSVAVGVFFDSEIDAPTRDYNFSEIASALYLLSVMEPNAHLRFYCVKETGNVGGLYEYVNNLRNTLFTNWAFITHVSTAGRCGAEYFGPEIFINNNNFSTMQFKVWHEMMHVFGAADQYQSANCPPTTAWGYLNIVNANSQNANGAGYFFQGSGESIDDLMMYVDCFDMCTYTRGQIGWRDSDGDGIFDPLDTFPDTTIISKVGVNNIVYTGTAKDKPLFNEYRKYNGATINIITKVEYRINGGAWMEVKPTDGVFDSGIEDFTFTTPDLPKGTYKVETRATNSVGNIETSYAKDEFKIADYFTRHAKPFAAYTIKPPICSINNDITFDASISTDLKDDPSRLEARWDFDGDGAWDTDYSTDKTAVHRFSSAGSAKVTVEVRNSLGLSSIMSKRTYIAPYPSSNRSQFAKLTATPENTHGAVGSLTLNFDATGTEMSEYATDELLFQWAFHDPNTWDTYPTKDDYIKEHDYNIPATPRSRGWKVAMEAQEDKLLGVRFHTERYVWENNYNHPPTIGGVEFCNTPLITPISRYNNTRGAYSVYVDEDYAYISDMFELKIINISDPNTPYLSGSCASSEIGIDLYVSGNYAYLLGRSLAIFDISDKTRPFFVGSLRFLYGVNELVISGNYAYIAGFTDGLHIVNISDPTHPTLISSIGGTSMFHIFVSGNLAYGSCSWSGLKIIDISDPAHPVIITEYNPGGMVQGVSVSGNYAYIGTDHGMTIINVSDPKEPVFVSNCPDVYANQIMLSGNRAYAYSNDHGMKMINISDQANPVLEDIDPSLNYLDFYATYNYIYAADDFGLKILRIIDNCLKIRAADVTDPDQNTTWDGLLEYRLDIDNDGSWDTIYDNKNNFFALRDGTSKMNRILCEVKDRFGATARYLYDPPDLSIRSDDISFSPTIPREGNTVTISAMVQNTGSEEMKNVPVDIYVEPESAIRIVMPSIPGRGEAGCSITWDSSGCMGQHAVTVRIDPDNTIKETDDTNNTASASFNVINDPPVIVYAYTDETSGAIPGHLVHFYGKATDPDNDLAYVKWNLGEGPDLINYKSNVSNVARTYSQPGTYAAYFTAVDKRGHATRSRPIVVFIE